MLRRTEEAKWWRIRWGRWRQGSEGTEEPDWALALEGGGHRALKDRRGRDRRPRLKGGGDKARH